MTCWKTFNLQNSAGHTENLHRDQKYCDPLPPNKRPYSYNVLQRSHRKGYIYIDIVFISNDGKTENHIGKYMNLHSVVKNCVNNSLQIEIGFYDFYV